MPRTLKSPPLQTKHLVLLLLNATVWTCVGVMWTGKVQFLATKRLEMEVQTTPARVRISIDGVAHEGGAYITTPIQLRFLPGKHRITFQRTGYHSNSSLIMATAEEMPQNITTVLEANSANFQEIHIDSPDADSLPGLEVSVDGGFETGTLPLVVKDALPGVHILEIRYGLLSKVNVRCQFEVPATHVEEGVRINIEKQGKKLRINGCKRLKN